MLKELRSKTEYTSKQMVLEFSNRKKQGKDPYYRKPITEPVKQ